LTVHYEIEKSGKTGEMVVECWRHSDLAITFEKVSHQQTPFHVDPELEKI